MTITSVQHNRKEQTFKSCLKCQVPINVIFGFVLVVFFEKIYLNKPKKKAIMSLTHIFIYP